MSVHDASKRRQPPVVQALASRFGPLAADDSYLHLRWGSSGSVEQQGGEILVCTSDICAQSVTFRPPELLMDGAGKVELLLELQRSPRSTDDGVARRIAHHTTGHGLLSLVVCFEALAALAPALKLDDHSHGPNHQKLEPWLVHVPPRLYSVQNRARAMWILHTIVPFATVLWGLWQIYFNLELVHTVVNDALHWLADLAETALGPLVALVRELCEIMHHTAILFTEHLNTWLRPVRIVFQPVISVLIAIATPVIRVVWPLFSKMGGALYRPLRLGGALAQRLWEPCGRCGRLMLAGPGQTLWRFLASVSAPPRWLCGKGGHVAGQLLWPIRWLLNYSTIDDKVLNMISEKLPQVLTLKSPDEAKVLLTRVKSLAPSVQRVAVAVSHTMHGAGALGPDGSATAGAAELALPEEESQELRAVTALSAAGADADRVLHGTTSQRRKHKRH